MEEEKKSRSALKTIMIIILSILGTILVLAIIGFTWLMIKNPLNIRAIILSYLGLKQIETPIQITPRAGTNSNTSVPLSESAQPSGESVPISDSQRAALEEAGIDPNAIQITPEMEACARDKLGNERVEEIINGAVPGPIDLLRAGTCF